MAKLSSEADLCTAFLSHVDQERWIIYPETCGWDILLVRKSDGFQIGIEAKLRLNAEVIAQCLEHDGAWNENIGPDCRAVLVPAGAGAKGFTDICAYIGITVIRMTDLSDPLTARYQPPFRPTLPDCDKHRYGSRDWYEIAPAKRCKLPAYVPDAKAGTPSPIKLTEWKIKAIKLQILLKRRGYVTREDFKHLRLDHRLWIATGRGWLHAQDGRFVAMPGLPDLKKQHPRNWDEILADGPQWMPKEEQAETARLI